MLMQRRAQLHRDRERLVARSATLRARLGREAAVLQAPLATADRVRDAYRWMRANLEWVAGAAVVLTLLRPRRSLRWAGRAWWLWNTWRRGQRLFRQFNVIAAGAAPRR